MGARRAAAQEPKRRKARQPEGRPGDAAPARPRLAVDVLPGRPHRAADTLPGRSRLVDTPPPRTRLAVDERRKQLLALGLELFSARSYDDVSIDDLAQAAGVSKGLLYHYFPTKRDLYVAAIGEASRQLVASTEPDQELAPIDRLRAVVDAYLAYVERHRAAYAALFRGGIGSDPEVASIVEDTRQQFLERLRRGAPWPEGWPVLQVALRGWIGFVEAAALDWVERNDMDRATLRDLCVALLPRILEMLPGIAPPPA